MGRATEEEDKRECGLAAECRQNYCPGILSAVAVLQRWQAGAPPAGDAPHLVWVGLASPGFLYPLPMPAPSQQISQWRPDFTIHDVFFTAVNAVGPYLWSRGTAQS